MKLVIALLAGYLAGTVPFAYLAGRLQGLDIRKHGSGNMGTTNAFRVLGKRMGFLVFIGDFLKGMLAAQIGLMAGGNQWGPWLAICTGLLSILGHSWNPFFGFKPTGKGVATGVGVVMRLMPLPAAIALVFFLAATYLSGFVSMGSVVGALAATVAAILFADHRAYVLFTVLGTALVIYRHLDNIKRIRSGTEPKVPWRFKF